MAKKPTPKSSYAILDEARVFYDRTNDTVHLTVKDKEIPEGIHLSLNSERADEKRLRRVLDNHGLLTQSDLMKEYELLKKVASEFNGGAAHMPRDSKNHIPFGFGAEVPMSWNIVKDPHLLVIGDPGSGKSVALQNIAEYVLAYGTDAGITLLDAGYSLEPDAGATIDFIKTTKAIIEARYLEIMEAMAQNIEYVPSSQIILIVDEVSAIVERDLEAAKMLLGIVRMGAPAGVHVVASSYGGSYYTQEKYEVDQGIKDAFSATFNLRNHHVSNRFSTEEKALLKKLDSGCGMLINSEGKTLVQLIPYQKVLESRGWSPNRRQK